MEKCISFAIRKASRIVIRFLNSELNRMGCKLNTTQIQLLSIVNDFPKYSMLDLSKLAAMERTTFARNAELLQKNGYISCVGKKNKVYSLTDQGKDSLAKHLDAIKTVQSILNGTITALGIDVDQLNKCLNLIIRALGNEAKPESSPASQQARQYLS